VSKPRGKILEKGLKPKKERVWEIDFLRALPIIVVVLYHTCFDFTMLLGATNFVAMQLKYPAFCSFLDWCEGMFYNEVIEEYLANLFGSVFIFLCGISCQFSHNNIRRGLLLLLGALVITGSTWAVSALVGEDLLVVFGILHLLGSVVLLSGIAEAVSQALFRRPVSPVFDFFLGALILYLSFLFIDRFSGGVFPWAVPFNDHGNYQELFPVAGWIALGRYEGGADFYPLFPNAGTLILGIGFGKVFYKERKSLVPKLYTTLFKPICFIGRHTAWFYLGQPVVVLPVLFLVAYWMGFRF